MFRSVTPTAEEVRAPRAGEELVQPRDVVMDRAVTLDATPEQVWPWLVQLGKDRAGWYFPRSVERFIPRSHRAIRHIDPRWQGLAVGDVIPDYGGKDASFEVAQLDAPRHLVFVSQRGRVNVSWSLTLTPVDAGTRLHLRLVLGPVKRRWLAAMGDVFDAATIAGMAAGLRERLAETAGTSGAGQP